MQIYSLLFLICNVFLICLASSSGDYLSPENRISNFYFANLFFPIYKFPFNHLNFVQFAHYVSETIQKK